MAAEVVGARSAWELAALIGLLAAGLANRAAVEPRLPRGLLVEVAGDVARPGTYLVHPGTARAAVAAAGGSIANDAPLGQGSEVVVRDGEGTVHPAEDPWLLGAPVDVDRAGAAALMTLPGIGPAAAGALLDERVRHGPFHAVSEITRARGIGPDTLRHLAPFLTVGDVAQPAPPRPLDLNRATADDLQHLPGIGPVRAAAIVATRARRPFRSVRDLQRVPGIGPATVAKLRARVSVEAR